ncbi:penicillin acylase family protein [Aureispira sp. CCB-E]|uniref:penicillin acylase family protein n=1 Tax=Aureispira sp. CCB-E TaxID=3051121 RepID=UPI0028685C4C|nr:penicillin acylase family protein [Aureispira sp. CCB-E]WMX13064.1 penicillin acylase family protein [Aureispira sp. CCB-E]
MNKTTIALLLSICLSSLQAQLNNTIRPQDVTIARDVWGVPHIFAQTDAEVIYGLAWAHCEDNFELIQHAYAATRRRAGEILGKDGAIFDVMQFMCEAETIIQEQYETAFSDDFKKIIRAYTQGMNDYAKAHPKELLLKKLFPINEQDVVTGYLLGNIIMTGAAFDIGKIFENKIHNYEKHATQPTGSNGFSISRKRMQENKTVFVSNSHQPLEGVLAWYEVHVNSEEGYNMLGGTFTLGMTPFVGTNKNLGWTHTVNHPDMTDVYKLKMHPKKKLTYWYDGKWEKLEVKKMKIKVNVIGIKFPVTLTFYKSKHGMAMKNKHGYYALRFSANKHIAAAEQWYKMGKANNFEEFKTALQMQQIPCFNVVYADKEDNIYNFCNGLIPNNRAIGYNWHGVMRGDTSENVWQPTFYKMEELPQLLNPASGYIFNSNNTPFTATKAGENINASDYPNELMGYLEKETNRSIRFMEIMDSIGDRKMTYEEFKKIKFDIQYAQNTFYTYNIENIDILPNLDPNKYPDLADVLDLVKNWDRSTDKEDENAAVFSVAFTYIIDELADRSALLDTNTLPEEVFVNALRKAKKYVLKHYGTIKVPFGKMHIHRREKGSDLSFPSSGMPENIAAMAYTRDKKEKGKLRTYSGESYILIAQYDDNGVAALETINCFGSSNRPESPHYTDQMEMYVNRQLKKMTLNKEEILKTAKEIYHPGERVQK